MKEIHFVDTTVRDGQLSLWALGMRTGAMLAIAEQMDRCGFESMEFFGFAGYIKMVREHKENPWDWMGLGAKKFHRTRLRYHGVSRIMPGTAPSGFPFEGRLNLTFRKF